MMRHKFDDSDRKRKKNSATLKADFSFEKFFPLKSLKTRLIDYVKLFPDNLKWSYQSWSLAAPD